MKKRYTFTINSGDHKYPWINWKSDWMRPDLSWRQIVCELKWVSLDAYDCQQRSILSWPWMIPVKAERFLAIKLNESHHVLNQVFAWECTQLQLDFHMTTAQSCSVRCKVQKTLWCCIFSFLNQHIVGMFYTAMESRYETSPLFHGLCNLLGQRKERQHTHTHTHGTWRCRGRRWRESAPVQAKFYARFPLGPRWVSGCVKLLTPLNGEGRLNKGQTPIPGSLGRYPRPQKYGREGRGRELPT